MPVFTCITCRVSFADSEIQRKHYKTDWHRYNLKRKVAEMPPVTAEVFQQKVIEQKREIEAQTKSKSVTQFCELCNKSFSSENAFTNHMKSKKHKDMLAMFEKVGTTRKRLSSRSNNSNSEEAEAIAQDESDDAEVIEDDSLEITQCLFCPHESQEFEENMKHMSKSHSFFIPDLEFVTDLKGLIAYFGEKVGDGKVCLYCNEKGKNFYSVEAVQKHMSDKGHCKINFDGDAVLEYAEFYDFSSSYPDSNENEDSGDENIEINEDAVAVDDITGELCLPSGARAGHRDFRKYYKQHLPSEKRLQQLKMVRNLMADYKALGWRGTIGEAARQKVRDTKLQNRQTAKQNVQVAVKANKFQKHYRPQVVF